MSPAMPRHAQSGQANLTTILLLLGLVVSGVWVWKRLSPDMQDLIIDQATLKRALGDKQHQVRGMAASHLGVIGDDAAVAHLLAALEDDHAYVRSSAALGLGRLRASAAKDKLAYVSKEDWDQTVRSRAREALERIR
ncbi:MAG: HEAT repeat domain-containing protein [Nitrospira sp.]|nr:MAG: HEAT repeat domain-containing protein [Nitrospira sp.]